MTSTTFNPQQTQDPTALIHKLPQTGEVDDTSAFRSFPNEIVLDILKWLPPADLCSLVSTNHRFSVLASDKCLWKPHLERNFACSAMSETIPVKLQYQLYSNLSRGICVEESFPYEDVLVNGDLLLILRSDHQIEVQKIDEKLDFAPFQMLTFAKTKKPLTFACHEKYLCVADEQGSLLIYKKDDQGLFQFSQSLSKKDSKGTLLRFEKLVVGEKYLLAADRKKGTNVFWEKDKDGQFQEWIPPENLRMSDDFEYHEKFLFVKKDYQLHLCKRDHQGQLKLDSTFDHVAAYAFQENLLCISFLGGSCDILKKNEFDQFEFSQKLKYGESNNTSRVKICGDFLFLTKLDGGLYSTQICKKNQDGQFVPLQMLKTISQMKDALCQKTEYIHGHFFHVFHFKGNTKKTSLKFTSVFHFATTPKELLMNIVKNPDPKNGMSAYRSFEESVLKEVASRLNRLPKAYANPINKKVAEMMFRNFANFSAEPSANKIPCLDFSHYVGAIMHFIEREKQSQAASKA